MDYKERLLDEFKGLVGKRQLLCHALENQIFPDKYREVLNRQMDAMMGYEECLYIRILDLMKESELVNGGVPTCEKQY